MTQGAYTVTQESPGDMHTTEVFSGTLCPQDVETPDAYTESA